MASVRKEDLAATEATAAVVLHAAGDFTACYKTKVPEEETATLLHPDLNYWEPWLL